MNLAGEGEEVGKTIQSILEFISFQDTQTSVMLVPQN